MLAQCAHAETGGGHGASDGEDRGERQGEAEVGPCPHEEVVTDGPSCLVGEGEGKAGGVMPVLRDVPVRGAGRRREGERGVWPGELM